jgi:aspartate/glutamate racemase
MSEIKIPTAFGPVSEMARKQAAENIKEDADLRAKVMEIILREVSKPRLTEEENKVLAEAEFNRRYPEANLP